MAKQVIVPDLTGSTLFDATAKLQAATLVVGRKIYQEDAEKPRYGSEPVRFAQDAREERNCGRYRAREASGVGRGSLT